MVDYVTTTADKGGVHINSGIPNHAFYLLAQYLGGNAYEKAGQIGYDSLQAINNPHATFADWAAQTVAKARDRFGAASARSCSRPGRGGWSGSSSRPSERAMRAAIHRSGGIGGLRIGGTINTDDLSGDLGARAAEALSPQRLATAASAPAEPGAADLHTYEVSLESGEAYEVTASQGASDVAAVLDELVNDIVRRQRGQ